MSAADESRPSQFDLLLAQWDEARAAVSPGETPPRGSSDEPRWEAARQCLGPLNQALTPLPGTDEEGTRFGRFVLRRQIGYGGFGLVFLADDPQLGRAVALKIPRPELVLADEWRQRFVAEARATAVLEHPNIVPVYEAGEVGPVPYLAMAYCPGPSLAAWLRERGSPVAARSAAELAAALAGAMHHAHTRGVLHRDLKPANVLLDAGDGQSPVVPKITDFGLARRIDDPTVTLSGAVVGTPAYMAPEQAAGRTRDVGTHTDVYALGTILYELLVGRPPFSGAGAELLARVQSEEPVAPRRLVPTVPTDLDTICCKCLAKEPGGRYPSEAALEDDLRHFLAGEPIAARPLSATARFIRWARRKPALAAAVGLPTMTLALAIAAAIAGTWKYTADLKSASEVAEGHRREADRQRRVALDNLRATIDEIQALESRRPDLHDVRQDLLVRVQRQLTPIVDDQTHLALADETNFWLELEVGDISRDNDYDLAAAWAHYLRARAIAEKVGTQADEARRGRRLMSYVQSRLGDVQQLRGDWAEAHRCFDTMFAARQAAYAERADRDARTDLAVGHLKLGDFLIQRPRTATGSDPLAAPEAHFTACRDLYQALAAEFLDSLDYARMLGHSWDRLADCQRDRRNWRTTIELLNTAIAVRRAARPRFPGCEPAFEGDCAHSFDRLREAYFSIADYERAMAANQETLPFRLDLAARNPRSPALASVVAISNQWKGEIRLGLGQPDLAIADFEASCVWHRRWLALQPKDPDIRDRLIYAIGGLVRVGYFAGGRDRRMVPYSDELTAILRGVFASDQRDRHHAKLMFDHLWTTGDFHLCAGRPGEAARLYDDARLFREDAQAKGVGVPDEEGDPLELRSQLVARAAEPGFDPFVELAGAVNDREFLLWMQRELFARKDAPRLATVTGRLANRPNDLVAAYAAARGFALAAEVAPPADRPGYDARCEAIIHQLLALGDHMANRLREDPTFARHAQRWSAK